MAQIKQNIEEWKNKLEKSLQEKNCVTDLLGKIEEKSGVKRLHIVLGLITFLGLYLMIGYGCDFLCNFIGFIYPAYASIKAIESKEKDDDTKWLTYWVVYSIFALVEFFTDIFLFWIPFYWFLKCAFLVWCMLPITSNGSVTIYYKFIRPYILKHEKKIDSGIEKLTQKVKEVAKEAEQIAKDAHID